MARRGKKSSLVRDGWVTDQHGSWPMGFVPLAVGLVVASQDNRLEPAHVLLVVAWTAGFFFFAVVEKYLKFRLKKRYRPATITYAVLVTVFSVILAIVKPHLLWWAIPFVPLVLVSFERAWAKRERELISRVVAILTAVLILAVADNLGTGHPFFESGAVSNKAWLFTALVGAYFIGTVPLVKTLIRERGKQNWIIASVSYHAIVTVFMACLAAQSFTTWPHVIVWALATARAWFMPVYANKTGKPWKPAQVGGLEVVFTLLIVVTLPW